MATLKTSINLSSSDIITSSTLGVTVNKTLTLDHGGIQRKKIIATSAGASATTIYEADDFAAIAYIYIKNLDTTESDYIYVYDETSSGDPVILKLAGGDWAWLPTIADKTLKAYASVDPTNIEFGVFGSDQ